MNPAVPCPIACAALIPAGSGTSHSARTRAFCANPPQYFSPTSQPVKIDLIARLPEGERDSSTVPAKSMPGTIG